MRVAPDAAGGVGLLLWSVVSFALGVAVTLAGLPLGRCP